MLRWLTAGESHGEALSAILEGLPSHVHITSQDIDADLQRRRLGYGRGARQNFEADVVSIIGGVRHGESQGGPVSIQVANSEWPKWEKVMSANPV
ncbi:MAG: chorismate synthase, partial [Actinomycetes bacterium]